MGKQKQNRQRKRLPVALCALCGKIKKLCKSHIIPKSFIREVRAHYKQLHWYELRRKQKLRYTQDGWKEYLLCNACEQRIGRWEKVVCEDLRGDGRASATWKEVSYDGPILIPRSVKRPTGYYLKMEGCDYDVWRLFLLSLLWKMDRSTLPDLAAVGLGESRAVIQEMILAGSPGEPMDYPCLIYYLSLSGEPMRGFMNTPHSTEYSGYRAIEIAFAGLGWIFIIDREVVCGNLRKFVLDRTGRIYLIFREATTVPWLMQGIKRLDDLGNWVEPKP